MSVTFSVAGSPQITRVDEDGDEWTEDEWPSYNVANQSASRILMMVGLDPVDLYGELSPEQARKVLARAIRARNLPRFRSPHTSDPWELRDGRGANLYVQGVDDERVIRWLDGFIAVLRAGIEHNQPVIWG